MFKKILIAEDHEIRNLGVIKTLEELKIKDYNFVNYCDEAFKKINNSYAVNKPYDLLITDLSFDEDHKKQKLSSGQELIAAVREHFPLIKIIAFSIEKRPNIIDELFAKYSINGFVSKGRNDGKELKTTIKKVYQNQRVIPQEIITSIRKNSFEFTDYDISILQLLAKGFKQREIQKYLKENEINPYSESAIEKRLNELRDHINAKNTIEMIVRCKDLGII